jgi:4-hydroxy-3-methylbut-2-enyl diphosphate reductase
MGVNFIEEKAGSKDFSAVKAGEVVILPAFGASVHEMKLLNERDVQIVDTTCPWVSKARLQPR